MTARILEPLFSGKDIKTLTIACFELIVTRLWYLLIVDVGAVGGLKVNYERPIGVCQHYCGTYVKQEEFTL